MKTVQELEELAKQGKIHLTNETLASLYVDYERFKNSKILEPLIIREILKRTGKNQWFVKIEEDWHRETWIIFKKDSWDFLPKYKEAPALANLEHQKNDNPYISTDIERLIEDLSLRKFRTAMAYIVAGRIRFLEQELQNIREQVKEQPDLYHSLWHKYNTTQKQLAQLDPFNKELNIGILGKPFFAGFADQE